MAYTEEDIEDLHDALVLKMSEAINERPADGRIPDHKLYEKLDEAFEESAVEHPNR